MKEGMRFPGLQLQGGEGSAQITLTVPDITDHSIQTHTLGSPSTKYTIQVFQPPEKMTHFLTTSKNKVKGVQNTFSKNRLASLSLPNSK